MAVEEGLKVVVREAGECGVAAKRTIRFSSPRATQGRKGSATTLVRDFPVPHWVIEEAAGLGKPRLRCAGDHQVVAGTASASLVFHEETTVH